MRLSLQTSPATKTNMSLYLADLPYLHQFWQRQIHHTPSSALDYQRDRMMSFALGVGIEQILRFMAPACSFEELVDWIVERNDGQLNQQAIQRFHAVVTGQPYTSEVQQWLAQIEAMPEVLSAQEIEHWQQHGYVILPNLITPAECAAVAQFVFDSVGALPEEPTSWYTRQNSQGIMVQQFQHPTLEGARRTPRLHKAMAQLWGTADLYVTIDRCGFNPPETADCPFPGPDLHWDSQVHPQMPVGTQAILYLTDTSASQGAFSCIPGFQHELDAFLAALPLEANPQEHIPKQRAMPIAGKAGDLIIWHHALPHGSSPNRSKLPRVVQYVNMLPITQCLPLQAGT